MEAMFERGYVFVPAETYFVVLEQRIFNSYRRVTATAVNQISWSAAAGVPGEAEPGASEPVVPH